MAIFLRLLVERYNFWQDKSNTSFRKEVSGFGANAPSFAGFTKYTYNTAPPGSLGGRGLLVIIWIPIQHMKSISKLFGSGRNSNKIAVLDTYDNQDREEPHGTSPPTPPYIRITYTAVR